MTSRPDQLSLSLGKSSNRLKTNLLELAADLNIISRYKKVPTISGLVIWLAETYENDPTATVELLNIAGHVAAGGDLDEWLKASYGETENGN